VCQSTNRIADNESSVIENLLEFRIGLSAVMCGHIGQIGRVEITGAENESDNKQTLPPKERRNGCGYTHPEGQTAYSSSPDRTSGGRKHVVCAPANQSDRPNH
jgi:hypothetical protein